MKTRTVLAVSTSLILLLGLSVARLDLGAAGPTQQTSSPQTQPQSSMQDTMKMHEQMMAEMKAAEREKPRKKGPWRQ